MLRVLKTPAGDYLPLAVLPESRSQAIAMVKDIPGIGTFEFLTRDDEEDENQGIWCSIAITRFSDGALAMTRSDDINRFALTEDVQNWIGHLIGSSETQVSKLLLTSYGQSQWPHDPERDWIWLCASGSEGQCVWDLCIEVANGTFDLPSTKLDGFCYFCKMPSLRSVVGFIETVSRTQGVAISSLRYWPEGSSCEGSGSPYA